MQVTEHHLRRRHAGHPRPVRVEVPEQNAGVRAQLAARRAPSTGSCRRPPRRPAACLRQRRKPGTAPRPPAARRTRPRPTPGRRRRAAAQGRARRRRDRQDRRQLASTRGTRPVVAADAAAIQNRSRGVMLILTSTSVPSGDPGAREPGRVRRVRRGRAIGPQAGEATGGRRVAAELGEQQRADFGIVAQPPAQLRPRRRRGLVPQRQDRHAASFAGWRAVVQRVIASDGAALFFYPERSRGDPGPAHARAHARPDARVGLRTRPQRGRCDIVHHRRWSMGHPRRSSSGAERRPGVSRVRSGKT